MNDESKPDDNEPEAPQSPISLNDEGSVDTDAEAASTSLASTAERVYNVIVRRPVAVTMVALAFMVFGGVAFMDLPVKLMPELTYPTLTIRTDFPAAAPDKVEISVSEPIQDRIGNIEGLKGHSSISRQEQSDIVLEFEWGTNMLEASSRVQDAINRARLDREVDTPQILRFDPAQDPIMRLMLYGRDGDYDLARLRSYAEDTLKPELAKLPGVATIRVSGGLERHLKITPDAKILENYNLTLESIVNVVRRENIDSSVGLVNDRGRDVLLRVTSQFKGIEDVRNLMIPLPQGESADRVPPIKLGTIASVEFEDEDRESITRFANPSTKFESNQGVLLEVLKMGDANIIEVAKTVRVALFGTRFESKVQKEGESAYPSRPERDKIAAEARAKLAELSKDNGGSSRRAGGASFARATEFGLLDSQSEEIGLSLISDQSVFIESSVAEVRNAVLVGGALAVLIIFLFLQSAWSTFLISLSIVLSVIATFIPMGLSDLTLNLMSLGGLALGVGMLVDNSIVVLESISRCRAEGDDPVKAAARGTGEVASAIIASTLTTIAVFFPIVFVQGMVGQVFKEQSLTVVFSLLASLIVALLVVPAYAGIRFGRPVGGLRALEAGLLGLLYQGNWSGSTRRKLLFSPVLIVNSAVVYLIFLALVVMGLVFGIIFFVFWGAFVVCRYLSKGTLVPLAKLWNFWWRWIEEAYAALLKGALRMPAMVIGIALGTFVIALLIGQSLDTEMIPPLNENEFYIDVDAPEGTRLERTDRAAIEAVDRAADGPHFSQWVGSVMTEVGGDASTTNRPVSSATVRYVVNISKDAPAMEEVGELLKEATLATDTFDTKPRLSRPSLFSLKRPVVVQVQGKDLQVLSLAADEVAHILSNLRRDDGEPMLREVKTSTERGSPQIRILLDQRKLDNRGLNKRQVADALALRIKGEILTDYEERGEKMDIFLNLAIDRDSGQTLERLRSLEILPDVAPGVRLGDLLQSGEDALEPILGMSRILRTETARVVEVTATPNNVALGTVRDAINHAISLAQIENDDIRVQASGQMQELDESNASLFFALGLAIFLVYVVMAVQFESLIDPLLIMGSVPLAAIGVIWLLWVSAAPLSVIVMLGMIVLAGIVVNNAIVLIDYANRLRGTGMNARDAVYQAGRVRLRPIAITTLTTVLGMLPMTGWLDGMMHVAASASKGIWGLGYVFEMLVGSGEGQELRAPMAKTVVVGLMTSTVLTLLVIPTLYALAHGERRAKKLDDEPIDTPETDAI